MRVVAAQGRHKTSLVAGPQTDQCRAPGTVECEVKGSFPVRTANNRSVEVCSDRLIKRQRPLYSRLERERSDIGASIGKSCGLFDVPDVLSFDDAVGEIAFRFKPDAIPLKKYLVKNPCAELAERCGRALAYIHLANPTIDDGSVFFHGDYGLGNLLYTEREDRLTIVDWSNAHWLGVPPGQAYGPAGLDLGIAILSLFHCLFLRGSRIPVPGLLGVAFLRGYALIRPCFRLVDERPALAMIHRRWCTYHFWRWGFLRTVAAMPSWVREQRFLASVKRSP